MKRRPLADDIARARAELAAADARLAALLAEEARLVDEVREAVEREHRSLDLHTAEDSSSVKHMDTAIAHKPKKIGRPITSDHPFVARAIKLHGSIKAAAKYLSVHPSTARSWYAEGEDARPIPSPMADRLARAPWSIPKSAWKRIS